MTSTVRERKSGEAEVNVAAWLNRLGLEQYEQAFRENDVDAEVLPELTAEDLIGLGVTWIAHRRKLLAAIADLRERHGPTTETTGSATVPAPKEEPGGFASSSGERRQITVMFCDLVGSTELSSRLDPEDLREVISAYHHAAADVVRSLDGFVAKYMGDGILVYFGIRAPMRTTPSGAVRAGLGLIDAVRRLEVKCVKLQERRRARARHPSRSSVAR
jgi:class 3 adenylate cyclase